MWQTPWGYPESVALVSGICIVGWLLQCTAGSFNFYLLSRPVNLAAGFLMLVLCIVLGLIARRSSFIRWLSGVPVCVSLLGAFMLLAILMGLTPQVEEGRLPLGLDTMTRSWPFVLVYLTTLLSLGTLLVRRLVAFRLRDYAFYLNHAGLWLLLAAAALGYADLERYVMYVQEGETQWRVYDSAGQVKELPVAIRLNDFDMDVYPPKLAVIDRITGEAQPSADPHYFQIDTDVPAGQLDGWEVEVKTYIHQAMRNSDSTYYEMPMPGSAPAVRVSASRDGKKLEGWICPGNRAQRYMTLPLDERHDLVMTRPEPRSFTSDIVVYTRDGAIEETVLEVNKPLRTGSWTIYQYGYDNDSGRLSAYSSFELVYDPWLLPVYAGILLMMLGSVCMLWSARSEKGGEQ